MIILPEQNVARGKVLLPVFRREWMGESTQQGVLTRWRLDARLNDGFVKWRGWFDDREDVDAFLWALANDTLMQQKALWRMSTPEWSPDIGTNLTYELATVTAFTSPTTGSSSWTVPVDWNNLSNNLHGIGGGGTSGTGGSQVPGSGGGAYAGLTNITLTKGATAYYAIGLGPLYTSGATNGGDTWFNKASNAVPASTTNGILAKGGVSQGAGGAAASCIGTTVYSGGSASTSGSGYSGTGGGGAAGPNGAGGSTGSAGGGGSGGGGANGGASSAGAADNNGTAGGNNRFGAGGGAPGLTTAINGGDGSNGGGGGGGARTSRPNKTVCQGGRGSTEIISEWGSSFGPGGGGGGGGDDDEVSASGGYWSYGGDGGVYGGGGGGFADDSGSQGGSGGQGLLMVIYNPIINSFNMPMLGM